MWLLIAFIAVPLIEITLFIQIGGTIGLGWTLAIVIFTAVLGTWLVRTQGMMALSKLQSSFSDLRDPTEPLVHGAMILFAGALLLTPGFFTDAVGFALLVPQFRQAAFNAIRSRVKVQGFSTSQSGPAGRPTRDDVIDGEYHEIKETDTLNNDPNKGPSKWTKH
ncbi:MAG: FxsA family protein [Sulfitobacter sp.]